VLLWQQPAVSKTFASNSLAQQQQLLAFFSLYLSFYVHLILLFSKSARAAVTPHISHLQRLLARLGPLN